MNIESAIRTGILYLLLLTFLVVWGCSGGKSNPVLPGDTTKDVRESSKETKGSKGNRHLWGMWQFICDPNEGTVEITRLRGPDVHINVLGYLENKAIQFVNLASTPEFILDEQKIHVDVSLKHPFAGLDEFSGFDVRGILISHGTVVGFHDPTLALPGEHCFRLLNADGYTRWWNPKEFVDDGYIDGKLGVQHQWYKFNATVNGYKLFTDDLDVDSSAADLDPAKRAVFGAGKTNVRHYEIKYAVYGLDNPLIIFNYAVDASWEFPTGTGPWTAPDDFTISSNSIEPWLIQVQEVPDTNSLFFNYGPEGEPVRGGTVEYYVEVFDWQGSGTIGKVWCELPGKLTYAEGVLYEDKVTSAVYHFYVEASSTLDVNGPVEVLFGAESAGGEGYQDILPGKKLTAFATHTTIISHIISNVPPKACVKLPEWGEAEVSIYVGDSVIFDALCSMDWEGPISTYEWDFDGDFIFDEPVEDAYEGPPEVATHTFINLEDPLPAVVYVNLRVTDTDHASDTLDLDPDERPRIEVWPIPGNTPPIALAHPTTPTDIYKSGWVSFDATASSDPDPDGYVVDFKWDFNGDGDYGDEYISGELSTPTARFYNVGTTYVDVMVYDDLGSSGKLKDTIEITVNDYDFEIIPDPAVTRVVLDNPKPYQGDLPPDIVVLEEEGTVYSYIIAQGAEDTDPDNVWVYHFDYTLSSHKFTLGSPPNPSLDWHDINRFAVNKAGTVFSMISANDVTYVPGEKPMYSYWNLFNGTGGYLQGSYILSVPTRVGIDLSDGLKEDWVGGNPFYLMQVFDLSSGDVNPYNFLASRFTGNFEGSGFSIDSITIPGMMGAGPGLIDYDDPFKMRLAIDDTYFETKDFIRLYILDSAGDIEVVDAKAVADPYYLIGTIAGLPGTAVDLECFNSRMRYGVACNWLVVLVDNGGSFYVQILECHEPIEDGNPWEVLFVASSSPLPGKPLSLDVDDNKCQIHVLSEYEGDVEATRFFVLP